MARFKELRIKKGLTQEELITQFNDRYGKRYGASSISMFENNKRIPETQALMDFADFFNVSVDYLLGRTDEPQKNAQSPPEAPEKQFDLASFIDQQNKVRYNGDTYSMDEADKERLQLAVKVVLAGMKKED